MLERTRWRRKPASNLAQSRGDLDSARRFELLHEVLTGFSRAQRELPPKFFYDERGSELFTRITQLDEYYLTRAELRLLETRAGPWLQRFGAHSIVELGAGSGDKTRTLLRVLPVGGRYVPVDISEEFLQRAAARLRQDYPRLVIEPLAVDITRAPLPATLPGPVVFAFLGSTIGNFEADEATRLLGRVRASLRPGDRLLLGADLVKDPAILERAYNDAEGITAEFNRNVLLVLNRELETDFDVQCWRHVALYEPLQRRIEMHLVPIAEQQVTVPGWRTVAFARGESIRTEISSKYDRLALDIMLRRAGLELEEWFADDEAGYALLVARPAT
jgi:L-histidine N-alpha-methyltransferase